MAPEAYPPEVWRRARAVRLLILDADGVLPDGSLYFGPTGEALKVFNVRDGHGLKMLQRGGIEVAFVSGRRSDAAYHRARELGISRFFEGVRDKGAVLDELLAGLKLTPEEVAHGQSATTGSRPSARLGRKQRAARYNRHKEHAGVGCSENNDP